MNIIFAGLFRPTPRVRHAPRRSASHPPPRASPNVLNPGSPARDLTRLLARAHSQTARAHTHTNKHTHTATSDSSAIGSTICRSGRRLCFAPRPPFPYPGSRWPAVQRRRRRSVWGLGRAGERVWEPCIVKQFSIKARLSRAEACSFPKTCSS